MYNLAQKSKPRFFGKPVDYPKAFYTIVAESVRFRLIQVEKTHYSLHILDHLGNVQEGIGIKGAKKEALKRTYWVLRNDYGLSDEAELLVPRINK